MKRLDLKETRNKFGRIEFQEKFSPAYKNRRKFLDTKYNTHLSFLHNSEHSTVWARKIRTLINNSEELYGFYPR